jgi:hypothetical protein
MIEKITVCRGAIEVATLSDFLWGMPPIAIP